MRWSWDAIPTIREPVCCERSTVLLWVIPVLPHELDPSKLWGVGDQGVHTAAREDAKHLPAVSLEQPTPLLIDAGSVSHDHLMKHSRCGEILSRLFLSVRRRPQAAQAWASNYMQSSLLIQAQTADTPRKDVRYLRWLLHQEPK